MRGTEAIVWMEGMSGGDQPRDNSAESHCCSFSRKVQYRQFTPVGMVPGKERLSRTVLNRLLLGYRKYLAGLGYDCFDIMCPALNSAKEKRSKSYSFSFRIARFFSIQ